MSSNINIEEFTNQVLAAVEQLNDKDLLDFSHLYEDEACLACESGGWLGSFFDWLSNFSSGCGSQEQETNNKQEDKKDYEKSIDMITANIELFESSENEFVLKNVVAKSLCPALAKISDDVFEIAKVSTPILLSLSLAGTITLPTQPTVFAAATILLARSSIATICKNYQ